MFGMGFFEIMLIAVIAIIALGPEKLPTAMVEVARFFKKFKSSIDEAKSTLDNELQISDMKEEANKFKAQIENAKSSVSMDNLDLGVNDILNEDPKEKPETKTDNEKVSFKKKKESKKDDSSEKFRVNQDKGADA
ncbi:Sec-independent protein translocase protein TatB [Candidatus Marinarcus aquaticus]|uniref:Sec-independent protein translocase protein TatB homolog n=1 Tax=Candidatus Marinarcus aquaticus TaxID=2044504 RepID=A0A4Q0XRS6_9BACT|nr:Sec-independent protein translocase protein TatB [Candidatus Marinarcus aquaticus]RXJ60140.1 twin-arginine translocase subunit TatB [Candidatus Marinarcus aquaticus]